MWGGRVLRNLRKNSRGIQENLRRNLGVGRVEGPEGLGVRGIHENPGGTRRGRAIQENFRKETPKRDTHSVGTNLSLTCRSKVPLTSVD